MGGMVGRFGSRRVCWRLALCQLASTSLRVMRPPGPLPCMFRTGFRPEHRRLSLCSQRCQLGAGWLSAASRLTFQATTRRPGPLPVTWRRSTDCCRAICGCRAGLDRSSVPGRAMFARQVRFSLAGQRGWRPSVDRLPARFRPAALRPPPAGSDHRPDRYGLTRPWPAIWPRTPLPAPRSPRWPYRSRSRPAARRPAPVRPTASARRPRCLLPSSAPCGA